MIKFKFEGWVHPKNGGDDYPVHGSVDAINKEVATREITKALKKKSAIVDFQFIEEEETNEHV